MIRQDHLLTILGEECSEVAKEVSKALRFGLHDAYEGVSVSEKLQRELCEVLAVIEMLRQEGVLLGLQGYTAEAYRDAKRAKIERFLEYSRAVGRLSDG